MRVLFFSLLLLLLSTTSVTIGSGTAPLKVDDQSGGGEEDPCSDPTVLCGRIRVPVG